MTDSKASAFRALHNPGKPFILANAWDIGSAKMLAAMGAEAIGTSSAAHAFTLGRPDGGTVTRDEALAHASDLIAAVDVPVSGDFEDGFGADPETCAETVRLSAEVGLAGISIEDTSFAADGGPYDFELAVERIRAAASAARALSGDFFLLARADGVMVQTYDVEEAIKRIQAFDEAGADGLYVPMPPSMDDLTRIIGATSKPVNVLAAGPFAKVSRDEFAAIGAARISLGSALASVTQRAIYDAATAMFENGDFNPLTHSISSGKIDRMIRS